MMQQTKQLLLDKFATRNTRVAVIGLGYVGLPLAVAFARAGYRVTGIDVDEHKVTAINEGHSYIEGIPSSALKALIPSKMASVNAASERENPASASLQESGSLDATTDASVLAECDAVSICVPTPLGKTDEPDISYIIDATTKIARHLHPGMVIVLESTTFPGTTAEVILPHLQIDKKGLCVGEDFFLAFSPERIDPGRTDWTVETMPKVFGGVTPACTEVVTAFYGPAVGLLVPLSSPKAAEMVKLFENTFRAVNIGLANELLLMCDRLDLNAWEILDAAVTKPFRFMKFTPGPGLGGHCIPVDPQHLSWKLRTLEYNARFIALASEINTQMPRYWVAKVQDALNDNGKALKGSKVLVLGVAYKKNVSDLRESPAIDILHLLTEKGADVAFHDPYVPSIDYEGIDVSAVSELSEALQQADCVVVATDHDVYDWQTIVGALMVPVIDTRHVLANGIEPNTRSFK